MVVGRKKELEQLKDAAINEYSQFVAVYGRRRVGKTFLIREAFDRQFTFEHTGVVNGTLAEQLDEFRSSLKDHGHKTCPILANWFEAFRELKEVVKASSATKKVIFIDELPCMDTVGSRLIPALEHFWNGWASARKDVLLIVCGSATSWILDKIIHNHGGLHGRVNLRMRVMPFTLSECEAYAQMRGLVMTRYQLAETYMVLGGIPYYWDYLDKSLGVSQNIDSMFFAGDDKLENEFEELYASLFKKKAAYMRIVTALARKKVGMTRDEVSKQAKVANSGTLTRYLNELEQCGFIRRYQAMGKKVRDAYYQLMDNFTLFHFRYISDNASHDPQLWTNALDSQRHVVWKGLAFERLCLWHVEQIKRALQIGGVQTSAYTWTKTGSACAERGGQIDLVIDRKDGIINLCEMKFVRAEYEIDAAENRDVLARRENFREATGTKKALHLTYVTTYGLKRNAARNDIQSEVTLDDLFSS